MLGDEPGPSGPPSSQHAALWLLQTLALLAVEFGRKRWRKEKEGGERRGKEGRRRGKKGEEGGWRRGREGGGKLSGVRHLELTTTVTTKFSHVALIISAAC